MCNTVLWGFCGWLRMPAFQWVVYFLLRIVSRVVDLEKQLPRQLFLGQGRADTALSCRGSLGNKRRVGGSFGT